ncbi:hypothetical protein MSAN_01620600 [Mycena sanguinolenta]|uniref:Uncharacterized protein n=1 Tax=Mycena sanguinolenta TaxID=230812 RepID=A0A8H7CUC5_9AGAR|nr:hypothetical protein MSAN_01620600 [Mycena sanguinolenta]
MPPSLMLEPIWIEEYSKQIEYSGSWSREYGTIYHESAVMRTTELGASMSMEFEGSAIKFLGTQGWDHGIFTVALDGQSTIVDGSCCIPKSASPPIVQFGTVPQVVQFEATNLTDAKHLLTITNDNAGPSGTVLQVDAFMIHGSPQQLPIPETDPESVDPPKAKENGSGSFIFLLILLFIIFILRVVKSPVVETTTGASPQTPSAQPTPSPATTAPPQAPSAQRATTCATPPPQTSSPGLTSPPTSSPDSDPAAPTDHSPNMSAHNADATLRTGAPEVLFASEGAGGSGQHKSVLAQSPDHSNSSNHGENARLLTELEEDEGFYHIKTSGSLSP